MRYMELMFCGRARIHAAVFVVMMAGLYLAPARGANIVVTNIYPGAISAGDGQAFVQFDVSWDASWRSSWTESTPGATFTECANWDAAWIFVKYRPAGSASGWSHATLSTNNADHVAPPGSTINVGLTAHPVSTNFGAGVFLYRSEDGDGPWTNNGVKLCWQYGVDGVARNARMDLSVHAIEMVYVPQGSFYLGDGTTNDVAGQFEDGQFTNAFLVTNDNYEITLGGGQIGSLGNNNEDGMHLKNDDFNDDDSQTLPALYPKGYNAFYCMKYEITQGQYTDFLNQLTYGQSANRYSTDSLAASSYYTIATNVLGAYTNNAPTRACACLRFMDDAAYSDWAGLRPMTELEYEKACRGPLYPVTNEFAWGSIAITHQTGCIGVEGSGTETANPPTANCNFTDKRPTRVGIFATATSSRQDAGASYWGIMEMSGNMQERAVKVGHVEARKFTGAHGDGELDANGDADAPFWPVNGWHAGLRGGGAWSVSKHLRVSTRYDMGLNSTTRDVTLGYRAVRSAPVSP